VVLYRSISVLEKVNKTKWLDEEQILNCRFFGTNFWKKNFSKGPIISSSDNCQFDCWCTANSSLCS